MRAAVSLLALLVTLPFVAGCSAGEGGGRVRNSQIIGKPGKGEGLLHEPRAIEVVSADGACVVIDRSGRVHKYGASGIVEHSWVLPQWRQGQPIDLTLSPDGTILVSDTHYRRILEFDLDGTEVSRFAHDVGLYLVRGIACGQDGSIYVADYGEKDRIHRFDSQRRHLGTFGSKGEGPGQFLRPEGLTIGADGDLYVVDCGHHRVLRFSPEGEFRHSFGQSGDQPGSFLFPFDIATGSDGTIYVVDYKGNRVQRFDADGKLLGVVGEAGREPGQFATPRGIAVLPRSGGDLVFVADTYNHRVQRFRWEYDL